MILFKGTLYGSPPRKSNARVKTKHGAWILSKKAREYCKSADVQLDMIRDDFEDLLPISEEVALFASVRYFSKLSDLSVELIMDILEHNGIVCNDNQIKTQYLEHLGTSKDPLMLFMVTTRESFTDYLDSFIEESDKLRS